MSTAGGSMGMSIIAAVVVVNVIVIATLVVFLKKK